MGPAVVFCGVVRAHSSFLKGLGFRVCSLELFAGGGFTDEGQHVYFHKQAMPSHPLYSLLWGPPKS